MKPLPSIVTALAGLLSLGCLVACDDGKSRSVQPPQESGTSRPVATFSELAVVPAPNEPPELPTDSRWSIAAAVGDGSWPRLLGDHFDGVADARGIDFDWSRPPEVAWRLPVGSGYGLGCVFAGRYYHCDADRKGSQWVERLRAFDLKDGRQIWSVERPQIYDDLYRYENGPRGTPATDGKSIVTFGVDGGLFCRDLADGRLKWSVATNEKYGVVQNFFGVGSSPLILESMVIVPVGGSPPEDQSIAPGRLERVSPNGSALVAFDLKTGDEVWRCGEDLASYSSPRTMQIGSTTVVLLFAREHLLAVDPSNGRLLWKKRHRAGLVESVNAMMPIVDGDRVFISECYEVGSLLLSVSLNGAETLWLDPPGERRRQSMRCHWSTPILVDGFLYGCSGRNNGDSDFRCVELRTGEVRWTDDRRIRKSVTRVGEHLVVVDETGEMQIVLPKPEALEVIARHDFGQRISQPCWSAPIVVGNRMLLRGDRAVLCLALPTL
jgi:outer membrane protein assembly factor BamB